MLLLYTKGKDFCDVYFITDDNDFLDNKSFLTEEFNKNSGFFSNIKFIRSLKDLMNSLEKDSSEIDKIKDLIIDGLSRSKSFKETDTIFRRLLLFSPYSESQLYKISDICQSNKQVYGAVIDFPRQSTVDFFKNNTISTSHEFLSKI